MKEEHNSTCQRFTTPGPRSSGKLYGLLFLIPGTYVYGWVLRGVILDQINNSALTNDPVYLIIAILGFSLAGAGLYTFWYQVVGFWTHAFTVEIYADRIIGYNMWKKATTILPEDIVSIKRQRGGWYNMIIRTNKNEKLIIPEGMDYYGKCVEAIREKAVNVKEVDYGGTDKRERVWNSFDERWARFEKKQQAKKEAARKRREEEDGE
jgi:hypothetical protein